MSKTKTSSETKIEKSKLPSPNNMTSIIVVTNNGLDYNKLCLESIRRFTRKGSYELIIVDNHSTDGTMEWLKQQPDVKLILNDSDIGFTRGCNQGIDASSGKYLLLLDADTVVAEKWLSNLMISLKSAPEIGAVGPVTNLSSGGQTIAAEYKDMDAFFSFAKSYNRSCEDKWEYQLSLSGFCMLIKEESLLKSGKLDEIFLSKRFALTDLSIRILEAGYQLLSCADTYIHHFNRSPDETIDRTSAGQQQESLAEFIEKWGFSPNYSMISRSEMLTLIHSDNNDFNSMEMKVLDIGCSCGGTLLSIRNKYKKALLYGIELNPGAAKIAGTFAEVQSCSCEEEELGYQEGFFDYIICADVLEHLLDPWNVLKKLRKLLKPDGFLLASIPNVMHHSVIRGLIRGDWNYVDAGLLDRTHLRFFTPSAMYSMFQQAGYTDIAVSSMVTVTNKDDEDFIDKLCALGSDAMRPNYKAYQILLKAAVAQEAISLHPYVPDSSFAYDRTKDGLLVRDKSREPDKQIFNRILLVYDLHEDLDRKRNVSVLKGLLLDPIKNSGLFREIVQLHRETMFEYGVDKWVNELLRECENNRPDLVVFHIPFCYQEEVSDALRHIRDELKIPVLGFTTDLTTLLGGVFHRCKEYYDKFIDCMTKILSIDTSNPSNHYNGNFIIGFPLVDYRLFNPTLYKKDIDVSFIGSVAQWASFGNTSRKKYLDYLKPKLESAGIKYYFIDTSGRNASIEDYAKAVNRSKIVLNFSQTTDGHRHMKKRVFEALGSGALLLEEEGPDTRRFFDAGRDYVEFSDPEDLFDKICYYVHHSEERETIVASGHIKAVTEYNADNLIRYVLHELGINGKAKIESTGYKNYADRINRMKIELEL